MKTFNIYTSNGTVNLPYYLGFIMFEEKFVVHRSIIKMTYLTDKQTEISTIFWSVSHYKSGLAVPIDYGITTIKEAIKLAKQTLGKSGKDKLVKAINFAIKNYDLKLNTED